VVGARGEKEVLHAARTIANSALVKTAFFGEDANWGRIMAALGRSGCIFDPRRVGISFDDVFLVENGLFLGPDREKAATEVLKQPRFTVTVHLGEGHAEAEVYTCDFSHDYVTINANYRS
jgi:glutamate N-acetyltransferase/amino-acid N-acetyltransferase